VSMLEQFAEAFDLQAAQQQLEIATGDPDPVIGFRFLPESPSLRRKRAEMTPEERAKTELNLRGRLSNPAVRRTLQEKNLAGYGIFFLASVSDGFGRKKENIVAGRCLVLDLDGSPLPPAWAIEPHWIQETSPDRHQCFFAIEPTTDLAGCEDASRRLAAHYGGDPAVCDIAHVFRLAGFYHLKRSRFQVRVVAQNDFDPPHKLCDFDFLPKLLPRATTTTSSGLGIVDAEKTKLLFAEMDVTKLAGNQAWLSFAMSLHAASNGDPEVRDLFLDWCATDPKYADEASAVLNRGRWDSFKLDKPTLMGVGTLKTLCRAYGVQETTLRAVFSNAASDFDGADDPQDIPDDDSWMNGPAEARSMRWDMNYANEMLDFAEAEILRGGAGLYQSGGRVVYAVRTLRDSADDDTVRRPAGALTVNEVTAKRLQLFMIEHAKFYKEGKAFGKSVKIKHPASQNLAELYLARSDKWNIPPLNGIIEAPTLRRDGSLVTAPGYDAASGLLLDMGNVTFPKIPDAPSRDEARAALKFIGIPFGGFPFVPDGENGMSASRSVMYAALLTALVRRTLRSAPMHGISAPTPGTGKTLAIQVVSMVAMGRTLTAMSQGPGPEEDEKRIFSILLQGDQIVSIDNVTRPIGGNALCTILTEETWQNRILGESRNVRVPTNVLWMPTGNNLTFEGDMTRRALLCQMDAGIENPESRSFDMDLMKWVPDNRVKLVAAGLTILRAFVCAGRPGLDRLKPYGSFEEWSNLVRGALVWLGQPDPCITRKFIAADDPVKTELSEFFQAVYDTIGHNEFTAGELIKAGEDCNNSDDLTESIYAAVPKANRVSLGFFLKTHVNKIMGGLTLRGRPDAGRKVWIYWMESKT
jgi:hypothetical protein